MINENVFVDEIVKEGVLHWCIKQKFSPFAQLTDYVPYNIKQITLLQSKMKERQTDPAYESFFVGRS